MYDIFTVRQILEKYEAKNNEIGSIFVALEKAYDIVPRRLLWSVLEKINVDITLINIIKEIYDQNKCHIKMGTKLSRGFKTFKGLLQRCSLSPTFFNIYLAVSLKEVTNLCKCCTLPNANYGKFNTRKRKSHKGSTLQAFVVTMCNSLAFALRLFICPGKKSSKKPLKKVSGKLQVFGTK